MNRLLLITLVGTGIAFGWGCKRASDPEDRPSASTTENERGSVEPKGNDREKESAEKDDLGKAEHSESEDHAHDEADLGTVTIGEMKVSLAQGHGALVAGKEGHLVVKLPYNDKGATVVRAWIGTKDRTASYVGKGTYAPSHDDYDVHATAPDPLPEDVMWWVEIEKPDGTTVVGPAKPQLD